MLVLTLRRLVALTLLVSLCLVPVSAHALTRTLATDSIGTPTTTGSSPGTCGDPDRGVGGPLILNKALAKVDVTPVQSEGGDGWWDAMTRWFTGLLQRTGFRY